MEGQKHHKMSKLFSDILLEPVITEKSTALSQYGKYTFKVAKDASKTNIKKAFEEIFPGRKVKSIETLKITGHKRRTRTGFTKPKDGKKAVITSEGPKIEYYPEVS